MIAYKGFTEEIKSILGNHDKATCTFKPGTKMSVPASKTVREGFHCCENPFECLTYYPLNGKNRFFIVEASGDIDEDAYERIACTEITILQEMDILHLAMNGMRYIVQHPHRDGWEQRHTRCSVAKDEAVAAEEGIAIARGKDPRVKGPEGSVVGLIREETDSADIDDARIVVIGKENADKWLRIKEDRTIEVME